MESILYTCVYNLSSFLSFSIFLSSLFFSHLFLLIFPKGKMSFRTSGRISNHPSIRMSIRMYIRHVPSRAQAPTPSPSLFGPEGPSPFMPLLSPLQAPAPLLQAPSRPRPPLESPCSSQTDGNSPICSARPCLRLNKLKRRARASISQQYP